jgi:hypothetical protein
MSPDNRACSFNARRRTDRRQSSMPHPWTDYGTNHDDTTGTTTESTSFVLRNLSAQRIAG